MRTLRHIFMALQAVIILTACTADNYEYCNYQAYFYFDCNIHVGTVLEGCLSPLAPGQFCIVRQNQVNGVRHIELQLSDQVTHDVPITIDNEAQRSCILGLDNGLIIGCSSLNNGALYIFDRLCPNCLKNTMHKQLQWTNNGLWVKCPKCERCYDLNNSGYVVSGDSGDKLLRYRGSYMNSLLWIQN